MRSPASERKDIRPDIIYLLGKKGWKRLHNRLAPPLNPCQSQCDSGLVLLTRGAPVWPSQRASRVDPLARELEFAVPGTEEDS